MSLQNRGLRAATWCLVAILAAGIFAVVFENGIRYRYEAIGGVLWRIDQITDQRCRVAAGGADCIFPSSASISKSRSTSTSTSTSTSIAVKR